MPFVNSISSSPERPNVISDLNCGSCVAAGAVCLIKHSHSATTSGLAGQFAREDNVPESSIMMGLDAAVQLDNICRFVVKNTEYEFIVSPWEMTYIKATNWMRSHPFGTVFVVFADGILSNNEIGHHAMNAIRTKDIVYVDFQTNRNERLLKNRQTTPYAGHIGPATCEYPFIGIQTQKLATSSHCLHNNMQTSTFNINSVQMKIVAFKRPVMTQNRK